MSGFKLYEISGLLRDAMDAADEFIDHETGEIPDDWAKFLDDVQMERDQKCLAVGAVIREKRAFTGTIKAEIDRLTKMIKPYKNSADRMEAWLAAVVKPGEKLAGSNVAIGWRKSEAVIIDDESKLSDDYFKIERTVSKTAVKEGLKAGLELPAHIETRQNIQIK